MTDTPPPPAAGEKTPAHPLKPIITYDDFAKLDLRVGTVTACEPHPNADKLLKVRVDLGELGERQICAGIRAYADPAAMVGRQIVVVCNLAPRMLRGEESNGMLLAASVEEAGQLRDIVTLRADKAVPAGSTIS